MTDRTRIVADTNTVPSAALVVNDPDPTDWDDFVAKADGGTVFQTVAWGEARAVAGWTPVRLAAIDDQGWGAAVQLGLRRLGPFRVLLAQRGPMVRPGAEAALASLLGEVHARARSAGVAFVKMMPDFELEDHRLHAFRDHGYRPVPGDAYAHRATYRIDLTGGLDAVRAGLEGRTRRAIARAERDGVEVRSGTGPDLLDAFISLARSTSSRNRFPAPSPSFLEDLLRRLSDRDRIRILVARVRDVDTAAAIALRFAGRCTYMWGGSIADRERRRSNPSEAVQWAAIRWAVERGCHEYDLQGVPLGRDGEPTGGLTLFKRGFGGDLIRLVGDLDRPISTPTYALWRVLEPLYLGMKVGP